MFAQFWEQPKRELVHTGINQVDITDRNVPKEMSTFNIAIGATLACYLHGQNIHRRNSILV